MVTVGPFNLFDHLIHIVWIETDYFLFGAGVKIS